MNEPRLAAGEVLPLVRRMTGAPDPLALHAALSDRARRPDTLLLESAEPSRQSVLVARSMLRLTCRGREVEIRALTPNGAALAASLTPALPSPLDALRAAVFAPRLASEPIARCLFAAGIFGYDLVDLYERLPAPAADPAGFPDFVFWVGD